jgi:soluble cytochrome b562
MAVQRKITEPTIKDYASDIFKIKGDVETIKRHMDEGKTERIEDRKTLADIKTTLIGSTMNGNKGIVFLLNDIDDRVKHLEKSNLERSQNESNLKWVGGFIITFFFMLIVYIIQHLPKSQ